jgi:DNA (cytosine-5)-methyltransferase 1
MMTLTFYDAFCGVGGFRLPLQELGWTCVGGCDIDPHAREVYKTRFSEYPSGLDIREVDPKGLPDFTMLCGGFPCPTFSIAGKRLGFKDPRGELVNEIFRIIREKRPRLLFLENVKGLLSHDGGKTFAVILDALDELDYDVQGQLLNSKDYGVPQNRERIFLIGHLRGTPRPEVFPLRYCSGFHESPCNTTQGKGSRVPAKVAGAIDKHYYKAAQGTRTLITTPKEQKMNKIGNISGTEHDSIWGRVYDTDGISPTINAKGGGLGAKTGLIAWSQSTRKTGKESRIKEGEANTLTAGDGCRSQSSATYVTHEVAPVLTPGRKKKSQNGRQIKEAGENAFTVTAQEPQGIYDGKKIRKLTPLECERLQGFPDNWTKIEYKGKPMSDQKRYECCGNAVTVPVIKAIGERLA